MRNKSINKWSGELWWRRGDERGERKVVVWLGSFFGKYSTWKQSCFIWINMNNEIWISVEYFKLIFVEGDFQVEFLTVREESSVCRGGG